MYVGGDSANGSPSVSEYFDKLYASTEHYWWNHEDRYATRPQAFPYSLLTQLTLRTVTQTWPGQALDALDLGAGEGTDAIRLALLGHRVSAVEISQVGAKKISQFAADAGVSVGVEIADLTVYEPSGEFDLIICNGVLHYIENKQAIIDRMQSATRPGGVNVISAWSTFTPVPDCHQLVPIYCDDENGVVARSYADWDVQLLYFERDKSETSHIGMPPHAHSHIKLIAQKPGG
jgi:2-polyprenyl-3-methyl-5-hydroxy-6-metoxy-1,4-benzoquinol methylase